MAQIRSGMRRFKVAIGWFWVQRARPTEQRAVAGLGFAGFDIGFEPALDTCLTAPFVSFAVFFILVYDYLKWIVAYNRNPFYPIWPTNFSINLPDLSMLSYFLLLFVIPSFQLILFPNRNSPFPLHQRVDFVVRFLILVSLIVCFSVCLSISLYVCLHSMPPKLNVCAYVRCSAPLSVLSGSREPAASRAAGRGARGTAGRAAGARCRATGRAARGAARGPASRSAGGRARPV